MIHTAETTTALEDAGIDPATVGTVSARPRRRWLRRLLIGFGTTLAVVLVLGALLYNFGSMWTPDPTMIARYNVLVAQGSVPAPQKQFHIPIPGCVCHDQRPEIVGSHQYLRIRDCMGSGCH